MKFGMSKLGIAVILLGALFAISGYAVFNSDFDGKDKATMPLILFGIGGIVLGGIIIWNDRGSSKS